MPDSNKAVFLSYAREDAAAARRIADALRAFGIEVWFDQNELRGGDAWDAKIRRQIRECALFVPIISANTEQRTEGYFRLEWDLAEERTHLMAKGIAFMLPVVIDGTSEKDALVPDRFRTVQWTWLPQGVPSPQFVEQMRTLLESPRKQMETGRSRPAERERAEGAASSGRAHGVRSNVIVGGVAAILLILGVVVWRTPGPAARTTAMATPPSGPATALPKDKSIAVLPFENRSAEKEAMAFFADGIHDELLTNLTHIRELRVVSRTSVEQYRSTKKSTPQIARELGVAYLLEGSVLRAGNRVRVTGQLIRAATDEHVWAQSYERELTDIFVIQATIASEIARALHAALSPQEKSLLERRPTENAAAYDLFLKARDSKASLQKQEALLSAAVTLDPRFADGWGELAAAHARIYFYNVEHSAARLAKASQAIDKAVQLAPESPDVIRNLGNYHLYGHRDYARATEQFDRLARLQPNNSAVFFALGEIQQRQARWTAAVANFRKATQLDPGNVIYSNSLHRLLRGGRRWEEAIAEHRRLAALRNNPKGELFLIAMEHFQANGSRREVEGFFATLPPEETALPATIAMRLDWERQSGNFAEAVRLLRSAPSRLPRSYWDIGFAAALTFIAAGERDAGRALMSERVADDRAKLEREPENTDALWQLGLGEAILGNKAEALRCAKKVADLIPESFDAVAGPEAGNKLALIYAWAGETDRAIAEAARLLQTPFSVTCVQFMKHDPWWFPLRGDPRFQALLNDPKNNQPLF